MSEESRERASEATRVRQWSRQTCSCESCSKHVVANCGARGTSFISFGHGIHLRHLTMADALDAIADALDLTHLGLA